MPALPVRATVTPLSGVKVTPIEFHGWNGFIGDLEDDLDVYRRAGGSGYGVQTVGRSHLKTVNAWRQEATGTSAAAWVAALQAAKGPVVSIKDPENRTLARCRIRTVDFEVKSGRGGVIAGGTAATRLIRVTMTIERLPDA